MNPVNRSTNSQGFNSWLWVTGLFLCLLGGLALIYTATATFASVILLASLLFAAGISGIVYGAIERKNGQMWPHLGIGVLALASSILIARNPIENTLGLTLVISFYLLAGGMLKVMGSLIERFVGWGYTMVSGLVSLGLGALVLASFPLSALWTIGTIVGVDFLATGFSLISLAVHYKTVTPRRYIRDWKEQELRQPPRDDQSPPPPL